MGADTSLVDVKPANGSAQAEPGAEPGDQTEAPRRGDKPPKPRKGAKAKGPGRPAGQKATGAVLKARSRVLERKLSELLTFPAVPATMAAPDADTQVYMLEHFTRSGPRTAAVLVEASETNEQLRALLERITAGGSLFTVVLALAAYAAPPVMWTIGLRAQAARITEVTTLDEAALARMMAEANARAQAEHQAAQDAAGVPQGAAGDAPAPGPDPLDGQPQT